METPNNKAGKLTEQVMRIFWSDGLVPLVVDQYNKAYSHVFNVLSGDTGAATDELAELYERAASPKTKCQICGGSVVNPDMHGVGWCGEPRA